MTFLQSIRTCLFRKYFKFSGRASRSEYWWFILFWVLLTMVVIFFAEFAGSAELADIANWILMGLTTIPLYAAGARRLHDTGRSGWWQIAVVPNLFVQALPGDASADLYYDLVSGEISFINPTVLWLAIIVPTLFALLLLVWTVQKGANGPNRYGDDPLQPDNDAEIFA